MVYIPSDSHAVKFHAYLSSPLAATTKNDIHAIFAIGAFSRFECQVVELILHDEPSFYDFFAESLRRAVDNAARRSLSAVEDEDAARQSLSTMTMDDEECDRLDIKGKRPSILQIPSDWDKDAGRTAVWYISDWADAEEIAIGQVVQHGNAPVLWKMFTELVEVPTRYLNYMSKISIADDLDAYIPYDPQAIQLPYQALFDYETAGPFWRCYVIAQADEYESMDAVQSGVSCRPMPETVYRLKEDVAERAGLISAWTFGRWPQGWPDNAIQMQQEYDVNSAVWRRYRPPQC